MPLQSWLHPPGLSSKLPVASEMGSAVLKGYHPMVDSAMDPCLWTESWILKSLVSRIG